MSACNAASLMALLATLETAFTGGPVRVRVQAGVWAWVVETWAVDNRFADLWQDARKLEWGDDHVAVRL